MDNRFKTAYSQNWVRYARLWKDSEMRLSFNPTWTHPDLTACLAFQHIDLRPTSGAPHPELLMILGRGCGQSRSVCGIQTAIREHRVLGVLSFRRSTIVGCKSGLLMDIRGIRLHRQISHRQIVHIAHGNRGYKVTEIWLGNWGNFKWSSELRGLGLK